MSIDMSGTHVFLDSYANEDSMESYNVSPNSKIGTP